MTCAASSRTSPSTTSSFPSAIRRLRATRAARWKKCDFCAGRIDRGEKPACMELCPGRARYWGDLDDPESEVSQFLSGRNATVLLEEEGTSPSVYYVS